MDKILLLVGGYFALKEFGGIDLLSFLTPTPNPVSTGSTATQPGGSTPVTNTSTTSTTGGSNTSTNNPNAGKTKEERIVLATQAGMSIAPTLNFDQWNDVMRQYGGFTNLPSPEAVGLTGNSRNVQLDHSQYWELIKDRFFSGGLGGVEIGGRDHVLQTMGSARWGQGEALNSERLNIKMGRRVS